VAASNSAPAIPCGQLINAVPVCKLIVTVGEHSGVIMDNTVTVKLHVAALPCESMTVHWTTFIPTGK
jgi:hypothetical protein